MLRPAFHFTPPANWLNDPNGLVWFDGEYHLFYQYHPHSLFWGPMHWGHAVSRDLVNWQHLPVALYPDETGMIFSGSAMVDKHNTAGFGENALVAIFTYNKDYRESQNLAYSLDRGRTWTKYPGNPVIPPPDPLKDFRDPKVIWHRDHWVLSLASKDEILFFISPDLKNWQPSGSFGGGYGSTEGVWETPDLFELPVDGGPATRWVLTVGVGNGGPAGSSGTQYFIGQFDGRTFTSENPPETVLWADFGADYYAPQAWNDEPNGRRLMLAWMNNWQYAPHIPATEWRGQFSLIREMALTRTADGIRLVQRPIPELQSLRSSQRRWQNETIRPGENLLQGLNESVFEISAEFQADHDFGFRVRTGSGEQTEIRYSTSEQRLSLDRSRSGQVDFHEAFAKVHTAPVLPPNSKLRLHIFVDHNSVEVFANDGLAVISDCIFPSAASQGLEIFAEGGPVVLNSLEIHPLNSARFAQNGQ